MKLHRFIIPNIDLEQDTFSINDAEIARQLRNVLRLVPGDFFIISDGNNNEAEARIDDYQKPAVLVTVIKRWQNTHEPHAHTALFCAILKRENFELVIQKATELGIKEIHPIISERTVKTGIRPERLEKIAQEAAEQSGRGIVPIIHEAISFGDALAHINNYAISLFCDLGGTSINEIRPKIITAESKAIFVGPEGGWSEQEKESMKKLADIHKTLHTISLSPLTLRGETAAIIATHLITSE